MRLYSYFGDFETAYKAPFSELLKAGIEEDLTKTFQAHKDKINFDREEEKLEQESIWLLGFEDERYPKLLKEISKFPPLLYVRGKMKDPEELCLAAVGTRMITGYGRLAASRLIEPLAEAGATIVSGMALGVDAAAHQAALSKGARTIAVLGGGVDEKSLYPKSHSLLAGEILEKGGALISEYPPGTPNFKQNFVARNRIISGLSVATLVVECDLKSGSLITAKYALEQNRQVYAVPGPIYSQTSQGPNNLLKMGAKAVTEAKDILDDLNLQSLPEEKQAALIFGDTPAESEILKLVKGEPLHINEIVRQSKLEASDVTSALTFLEMKGKIRNLGGQQYVLSR